MMEPRVTRAAIQRNNDTTSSATLKTLLTMLKVKKLHAHQLKMILESGVCGRDVFAQIAPGDGKTLGFVGAFLTRCQATGGGVGILIEPLVALLYQLEEVLVGLGIEVIVLTLETREAVCQILKTSIKPSQPIVIISRPEEIVHPEVLRALNPTVVGPIDHEFNFSTSPVVLFCIDEAHCVAYWSIDFLVDWGHLKLVTRALVGNLGRRCPLMLLTGTATETTRPVIMNKTGFNIDNHCMILKSSRKSNIAWNYIADTSQDGGSRTKKKEACLMGCIRDGHVVVVYCTETGQCERRANDWNQRLKTIRPGLRASVYHGQLSRYQRKIVAKDFAEAARLSTIDRHREWSVEDGTDKRLVVIFCTLAFGMGVDIFGIERVILWNMPRNLASTIQKGMRGGRAPLSTCTVYVYMCWNEYTKFVKQARSTGKRALSSGEEKQNNNGAVNTELLRHAEALENELTTVWKAGVEGKCREVQHETFLGTDVGTDCGRCDYCVGKENESQNEPDLTELDQKIRLYFNDFSQQSVNMDVARKAIYSSLTLKRTHAVVAVRIRYFVVFLGQLKLVVVKEEIQVMQGIKFEPFVVLIVVQDESDGGSGGGGEADEDDDDDVLETLTF